MPLVVKNKVIGEKPIEEDKPILSDARKTGSRVVAKRFSLSVATKEEAPVEKDEKATSSLEELRQKRTKVQPKQVEEIKGPEKPKKVKIQRIRDAEEVEDAALVVNGQKRKLSKNSAYMLDMVSLDDE